MQSQFEPYLKDVENRLRTLSKEEKAREITEIRSHLEAASEDYCDQGMSQERATMLSTEEFGAPKSVAKQLIKTIWRARLKNFPQTFFGTILFCLPIPILVYYLCFLSYNIVSPHLLHQEMVKNNGMNQGYVNELITFFLWNFLLFATLTGYFIGRFLPTHAWRSIIVANTMPFLLLGFGLVNVETSNGNFFMPEVRDAGTTTYLFTLFIILWLMLSLKRYVRFLLALVPIAICYLCLQYCGINFNTGETTNALKSFVWVLFNPLILGLCLIVTAYITVSTSLGIWLGRLHARAIQQRRMRAV
jgi:hypothetical protein